MVASVRAMPPWRGAHPAQQRLEPRQRERRLDDRPRRLVNVYDEVTDPRRGRQDHFALQYKGLDSDNTGWLQFVAPEVEAFDAKRGRRRDGHRSRPRDHRVPGEPHGGRGDHDDRPAPARPPRARDLLAPQRPPVRRNLVGKRGPADKLQPAHHSALVRRRPEFDYFAH
jgi:hypothetical protein